ncbi:hypothetical protein NZK33_04800 [Cyanobium sp. FGCU-6]|nr:hypothetical protein [Cyanobium sp. FGCU6]
MTAVVLRAPRQGRARFTCCQAVIRQWPLVLKQTAMASGITVTSNPDPAQQLQTMGVTS